MADGIERESLCSRSNPTRWPRLNVCPAWTATGAA